MSSPESLKNPQNSKEQTILEENIDKEIDEENELKESKEEDLEEEAAMEKEEKEDLEEEKEGLEEEKDEKGQIVSLQLGDVIQIKAPSNINYNNKTFIIDYIDSTKIMLINVEELNKIKLKINEDGTLGDGSIESIALLYRNDTLGYARQNGLLPDTWVNVYFGGDIPVIITGKITNIEEDMIEITSYPDNDVLYINFAYKGIPEDIPLETIEIREAPEKIPARGSDELGELEEPSLAKLTSDEESVEAFEVADVNEDIYNIPTIDVKNNIREFIIRADELQFGEEYGAITQLVNVDVTKERYNVDTQTNDLLDEILSTIPNAQRTASVLNNVHIMIERFKQLRMDFSEFDERNTISGLIHINASWKPLANDLTKLKHLLYWIIPVAKNVKKVYNIGVGSGSGISIGIGGGSEGEGEEEGDEGGGENSDIVQLDIKEDVEKMKNIENTYKYNDVPDEQNKYITLMTELSPYYTPFQDINPENVGDVITDINMMNDLNVVIDNLGDFYSTIAENDFAKTRRFVISKYNLGLKRLEVTQFTGSKMIAHRVNLTPPDVLSLKSIVTLPEPTIRFSHVNLPGTNMLEKANLNSVFLNYWQLLKQNTHVDTINVDNLEDEIDFKEDTYINHIKNYTLSHTDEMKDLTNYQIYEKFLKVVVPKTKVLFNLVKKYIKGKLSLVDIVQYLEPFLIYTSDLTYFQYKEINEFIHLKISEYNKNFIERNKQFYLIKSVINYKSAYVSSAKHITSLLPDAKMKKEIFEDSYDFDAGKQPLTNSELIRKMKLMDFGNAFDAAVSMENMYLMLPENVGEIIDGERNAYDDKIALEQQYNACATYIIAKQYNTIEELEHDNGKHIYFDKKFDKTLYSMLDDYEKDQHKMAPDVFHAFLTDKLQKKYRYPAEEASDLAETLIGGVGTKKVVEGNYAMIYDNNTDVISYYKRHDNRWTIDDNIDPDIMLNNQNLLCNFQNKCIEVDKKYGSSTASSSTNTSTCEPVTLNKSTLVQNALKEMVNEFDKNYAISKDALEARISSQFEYYTSIIHKLTEMHYTKKFKYNDAQFNLGIKIDISDTESDVVISPYLKLRDIILGQGDFVKKQNDIIQFAMKFTKVASDNFSLKNAEDLHWRYCIKTNTKLLPTFLYTLAGVFANDPDNYGNATDIIIKEIGALSDDGDAWVDKNSGYIIKRIDFDIDEGYEEGYKKVSRSVMEQDAGNSIISGKKEPIKYTTPETKIMAKIISALSEFMGISIEDQREFIIKIASAALILALPSEELYIKKMNEMSKKGKEIPDYKYAYNQTILFLTLGAFLIGIQVSIPSIKTRKTFPGCVKSFDGFPFEGVGDMSALTYLSCVANKIVKEDPWSALKSWPGNKKQKDESIAEKIKSQIEKYYLMDVDVVRKFSEKTEYLLINPNQTIPQEHDIAKWTNFLPPLKPIKIPQLINISSDFKRTLLQDFKSASGHQREKVLIIQSKIILFSLGIQQKIQKIVDKKKLLLSNSANEPFLDNACCNEKGEYITIKYFEHEDSDITTYNSIVQELSNILDDIVAITKSPYLFCRENSKNIYPTLTDDYNEETIYQAFIILCKFNSDSLLTEELMSVCSEKPANFNKNDTIGEKIKKLKQDGKNYTNQSFLRLMQIINRSNIIKISFDTPIITPVQQIRNALKVLNADKDQVVPIELRKHIDSLLDTFDIAVTEDTLEMKNLKDYLGDENDKLRDKIVKFIGVSLKSSKKHPKSIASSIKSVLENIMVWDESEMTSKDVSELNISDDIAYNSINFMKEYMQNILKTFPEIILNKVDYKSVPIPKYWDFSKTHENDIRNKISEYYVTLRAFYDDKAIQKVITSIPNICNNLLYLTNRTPSFTDIHYKGSKTSSIFDKRTSMLLFENYFLQALDEYIKLASNASMIVREIEASASSSSSSSSSASSEFTEDNTFTTEHVEERGQRLTPNIPSELLKGETKELNLKIADLLVTFLNIMTHHKSLVNISYSKIMDVVFKSKEREKDTFTDRLQALTDEERNIDTMLKINKLGVWGKGLKKGMTTYVKETYDEEREAMEKLAEIEKTLRKFQNVNDNNIEQFADDYIEEQNVANDIERDEYDMGQMTEDFMDGNPYGDEEENDEDYD